MNHRIRVPQVRCISETSEQMGVMQTSDALRYALDRGLDLVEISPYETPPVCRIMNFGKYRYEENRKEKKSRKHQINTVIKEIKFHVNVEDHDYMVKLARIREFLEKGHRVKASLMFRGRENEHRDLGFNLMTRLTADCGDISQPDAPPRLFGNRLILVLHPQKMPKTGSAPKQNQAQAREDTSS
jgi:translation initiation factor IF-3